MLGSASAFILPHSWWESEFSSPYWKPQDGIGSHVLRPWHFWLEHPFHLGLTHQPGGNGGRGPSSSQRHSRAFVIWPECLRLYTPVGFGYQVVCWNESKSQAEFGHTSDARVRQKAQSSYTAHSCKFGDVPALFWGMWTSTCPRDLWRTGPYRSDQWPGDREPSGEAADALFLDLRGGDVSMCKCRIS